MCDQVAPIFLAIEFIESHLQEDITVAQIADAAGYSLFHFMRKFNQMVHHTPYDYLMRRRLSEAARALIFGKQRIIDIAQDFCFNDQETFSRVFRKMFHMTPSQCRKEKGVAPQYLMQAITIDELRFINGSHFTSPLIFEQNELHLHGLMTTLNNDTSRTHQREQIWTDFCTVNLLEPQAKVYEVEFIITPAIQSRHYFMGVETHFFTRQSPLMARYIIHTGQFVKMEVPEPEIPMALQYLYSTWIPRSRLVVKKDMTIFCWSYTEPSNEQTKTILVPLEQKT